MRRVTLGSILFAVSACASVEMSVPSFGNNDLQRSAESSERVELKSAASQMSNNPWSEDDGGVMAHVFGHGPKKNAIEEYLGTLSGTLDDQTTAVFADADDALARARRVAEAGRLAVTAIKPVDSDIDTLERAIGEVRKCRSMYTRALERLTKQGADVNSDDIRVVRDAFTQTIHDIGYTADIVASRVRDTQRREQYAQPTGQDLSVGE